MAAVSEVRYVQWVQRTLNRELDSELVTNGMVSPEYREAVETFQLVHDLAVTGKVDKTDQNRMIRINHKTNPYVNWVQEALRAAHVDPALPISGTIDKKTSDCIKAFQAYHDLVDDGWVGPQTESALIDNTGIVPGGHITGSRPAPRKPKHFGNARPKPFVLPVDNAVTRIISSNYTDALYNRSKFGAQDRQRRLCVLGKLKRRHGINDRFPSGSRLSYAYHGSSRYQSGESIFMSAREFLTQAVSRWSAEDRLNAAAGRALITDLMKLIETGLRDVGMYDTQMRESTFSTFRPLLNEVTAKVESLQAMPNSILACYRSR